MNYALFGGRLSNSLTTPIEILRVFRTSAQPIQVGYSEKVLTLASGYVILASDCLSLKPLLLRCARNALRYIS
jgi:hypothetical protein